MYHCKQDGTTPSRTTAVLLLLYGCSCSGLPIYTQGSTWYYHFFLGRIPTARYVLRIFLGEETHLSKSINVLKSKERRASKPLLYTAHLLLYTAGHEGRYALIRGVG